MVSGILRRPTLGPVPPAGKVGIVASLASTEGAIARVQVAGVAAIARGVAALSALQA
jgi:hypothetical protein